MRKGRPQKQCSSGLQSRQPRLISTGGGIWPAPLQASAPLSSGLSSDAFLKVAADLHPALPGGGGRRRQTEASAAHGNPVAISTLTVDLQPPSEVWPGTGPPGEDGGMSASDSDPEVTAAAAYDSGASVAATAAEAVMVEGAPVASAGSAVLRSTADGPFSLVSSVQLAGGRLDVVRWRGDLNLRVWTPAGFSLAAAAREPYPVMYLNDGQNLYDDRLPMSGHSWHAAEAASGLINSGELPPFVIVGIDHSGAMRPYDYLPYPPGNANGFRLDADKWPGGGVDAYLAAVLDEILPYMERSYGVSPEPSLRGFGGSSFGGICSLCCAMRHPGVFGSFLVESPSLWFGDEKLLKQELPAFQGPWPARLFLAMGTKEYSGIRKAKEPAFDAQLVAYTHQLAELLESKGLTRGQRLQVVVEEGATHTESAWAGRLPAALRFLGLNWWRETMSRRRDQLYFTVPRKLQAGRPAVLFFNQARSASLTDKPRGSIKLSYGFNVDWSVGVGRADMVPAAGLALLQRELQLAAAGAPAKQQPQLQQQLDVAEESAAAAPPPPPPESADAPLAAALPAPPALMYDIIGDSTVEFDAAGARSWLQAAFTVPAEAYEMHLAFHDGAGDTWDNNAGSNFYARVRMDMTDEQRSHTVDQAMREGPAWGDVQEIANRRGSSMHFTTPEVLIAGEPAMLYVNRCRVRGLERNPNLRTHFGFNSWQLGNQEAVLKPTSLWRGEHTDWWCTPVSVPGDATDLSFVLTDGHGIWDNNGGNNYVCTIKQSRAAAGAKRVQPRGVESVESMAHAEGNLHIVTMTKRQGNDAARRSNKWTEEKRMRVWTPPGFDAANPPPGGYPVLFMQDGQNMFEDWLAHQGVSWRVGYTASELITRGELPPFVVVAVDSAGAMRSLNYLPYPPGTGVGGFRGDAERWPGGGLESYMTRLVEEIMPLVQERFSVSSNPAKVAFGGGSFAGVAALYAAMHYPHVFGAVLAESPSLWIAEGRFLQDMRMHRGMLPERLFLGCGTREYSATRDHDRDDMDALLLGYCQEAAGILEAQGMRGGRLQLLVEDGAGHHELAWQWRLTGAMRFLFNAWWDE